MDTTRLDIDNLFRTHRRYLAAFAFRLIGNMDDADDAVMDAFERLQRANVREAESALPYLRQIIRNLAIDRSRRQGRQREVSLDERMDDHERPWEPVSPRPAPHTYLERRQRRAAVHRELRRLPARHLDVVQRYYLQDCDVETIAQQIGRPAGTVKSRLFRARENLERRLARHME